MEVRRMLPERPERRRSIQPGHAVEEIFTACGRSEVKTSRRRWRHCQTQLIREQRREPGRHTVRFLPDAHADTRVAEAAVPTHLRDAHIAVPVRNGPVTGECLEPDATQPK